MLLRKLLAVPLLALASGCATTPVRGYLVGADEAFIGQATGYMNGEGTLSITSSRGVTCTGTYASTAITGGKTGSGQFECTDGRKGPLIFNTNGFSGNGFATNTADGRQIRFAFGHAATDGGW